MGGELYTITCTAKPAQTSVPQTAPSSPVPMSWFGGKATRAALLDLLSDRYQAALETA